MSGVAGKAVSAAGKAAGKAAEGQVLNKGAKRDPELYVGTRGDVAASQSGWQTIREFIASF